MLRRDFLTAAAALAVGGTAAPRLNAQATSEDARRIRPASPPIPAGSVFSVRGPDGVELSAMAYGPSDARGIVLIHGLGQSRLSWDRQVAALADRFRVVTFDLRGHGESGKPDRPEAYSDGVLWGGDLAAIIDAQALDRPILVGWSLGGQVIGQYLMAHGSSGVGGVNLVNAVTKLDPDLLTPLALDFAGKLASRDLQIRSRAIADFLKACFAEQPSADALELMIAYNGMVPRLLQQEVVKMTSGTMDEAFAGVDRVLVTYGALDRLTRPGMSRRIVDLNPMAKLSIYEKAGHSPFIETPDRFNQELTEFASGG